ncbi:MAG TPA: DUF2252 family protein [Gammaproteobacteria bacterium]|nr:DUF2252 family protein [Gammaproteobacteria bacterium]
MAATSIIEGILGFNRGRDPRRLELKYQAMRASPFGFLRGTCHLFYADLPQDPVLYQAPHTWISGDLHLENFGAYKGDNRLVYFDLNDFDEACLAPCSWELLRLITSVHMAGPGLGYGPRDATKLGKDFLDAYCRELAAGKPRWIERPLAEGLIKKLLQDLKKTQRRKFLDKRSTKKHGHRSFKIDGKRSLQTPAKESRQVALALAHFAQGQEHPGFYRVLDVADRIAGTGSLGVKRYAVLVEGRGSPDGNFMLDLKEALPSATASHLSVQQPSWSSEAERVATLQKNIEAIAPALLTPLEMGGRPYVLKELQPVEQRVNLAAWKGKRTRLETIIGTMGELTAWGQLRTAGWLGSAEREILSAFGAKAGWVEELLESARQRSRVMTAYWLEYCAAYDKGAFKISK